MTRAAVAALFWIAVGLIQKFNWNHGTAKAVVLLAMLASTPFIAHAAASARFAGAEPPRALRMAAILLLVLHAGYAVKELRHPSLIDAATTTLAAGAVLRNGGDPYATPIDAAASALMQDQRFAGYKYLPLTIAAYLPLGAPLAERGVVLTNLLLHLAVVWLVFQLANAMACPAAGWLAVLIYLSLPLVPFQLFAKGVTDLAAVLPLLAALLLVERRAGLAWLCVGLSLAAKPLPAALLLPCCLPATTRARMAYALGVAIGLLPTLPFLLWAPGALFDNLVLFNLTRPADSTSWLFDAAPWMSLTAHAAMVLGVAAAAIRIWRHPPTLAWRCGLGAMLVLGSLLSGPAAHHNYQLWWLPLAAALLGVALMRERLPSAAAAV